VNNVGRAATTWLGGATTGQMVRRAGALGGVIFLVMVLGGWRLLATSQPSGATSAQASPVSGANVIAALPANVDKDYTHGTILQNAGRCDKAIPLYLKVINESGTLPYAKAYVNLGDCYQDSSVGASNVAILYYDKAIALDPTNFGLYIRRAETEFNIGLPGQAIIDEMTALRMATKVPASYTTIAQDLDRFADFGDAITAMNYALQLAPDNSSLYVQRAGIYLDAHENTNAYQDYRRAIQIAPFLGDRADIYADLANVYDGVKNFDQAYVVIDKAISLQPNNLDYYFKAGDIHQDASQYTLANSYYDQVLTRVSRGPNAERAHESKGDTDVKLGQYQKALNEYRQAEHFTRDLPILSRLKNDIKSTQALVVAQS